MFVCVCRLVSLCTYRRTRRCLCRHCLWLRGEWEHKSEPVQRLNCRLTGRSMFSHVTGHSPNGGGPPCAPRSDRSSSGTRVYFHHMWSGYCCNLLTQWDWMELSKKNGWCGSKEGFFSVCCAVSTVWRCRPENLTGSSMTPWNSTSASASSYFNIMVNLLISEFHSGSLYIVLAKNT